MGSSQSTASQISNAQKPKEVKSFAKKPVAKSLKELKPANKESSSAVKAIQNPARKNGVPKSLK